MLIEVELVKNPTDKCIDAIQRIENKIFPKNERMDIKIQSKKTINSLLVISQNTIPVAYLIFSNTDPCKILKLAVDEKHRRKQFATKLMEYALNLITKTRLMSTVLLHVDPSRLSARNLYLKCGFVDDIYIENYYEPQRDAIRMKFQMNKL